MLPLMWPGCKHLKARVIVWPNLYQFDLPLRLLILATPTPLSDIMAEGVTVVVMVAGFAPLGQSSDPSAILDMFNLAGE